MCEQTHYFVEALLVGQQSCVHTEGFSQCAENPSLPGRMRAFWALHQQYETEQVLREVQKPTPGCGKD